MRSPPQWDKLSSLLTPERSETAAICLESPSTVERITAIATPLLQHSALQKGPAKPEQVNLNRPH
ncbi:MAG: hypothetical protein VX670_10800, partial [Candidatus Latescibacterota bacterium]|nr:hypothetical protein [Candidatus Latescibacterota bacterium]